MILPGSYLFSILLLIVSLLCFGSWANTYKATGKWRFELFYYDFAVGAFVVSIVCALTVGTMGWDGFSFIDDIRLAGKKQDLFALLAGAIFNLGNMLLVAAISIAGISVAFTAGAGVALVVSGVVGFAMHRTGNPMLIAIGSAAIIGAVAFDALAYKGLMMQKLMNQIRDGKTRSTKKKTSSKGLVIAVFAGVLMGSFYPLLDLARDPDLGVGPYSLGFLFALGIFFTTFVYNLFFMNIPVQGQPLEMAEYFHGKGSQHILGLAGGGLFMAGVIAMFVTERAAGPAMPGANVAYALSHGGVVLAALWGFLYWKEFRAADPKTRTFVIAMIVLLVVGVAALSIGQVFGVAAQA